MTINSLYNDTEYKLFETGNKKIILSTLDTLSIGEGSVLGSDFSSYDVIIFAENVVLSKSLQAKSFYVSAHSIITVDKYDLQNFSSKSSVYLQNYENLNYKNRNLMKLLDYSNQRYVSLEASSISNNIIRIDEQIQLGSKAINSNNFFAFHPVQCSMLLQKAKFLYRESDPIENKDALDQSIIILNRLREKLEPFKEIDDDSELAKFYKSNEASFAALSSIASLKSIFNSANDLLGQIKHGSDYYGNSYNYVPLASFDFYKNILDGQINSFGSIEESFLVFTNTSEEESKRIDELKKSRASISRIESEADNQIQDLKIRIKDAESQINDLQSKFSQKKQQVIDSLKSLEHEIERSFYLDIKSLLSSLTTLAFLSESPAGWAIAGSEIAYDISQGVNSVENEQGIAINKNYLVRQLKGFEGDLTSGGLDEESKKLNTGIIELDDPGANKLLVTQKQLYSFLDQFYSKFSSIKDFENLFSEYVNLVLERNNKVVYYNAMVTIVIKNNNIIKDAKLKIDSINDKNLDLYKPDLPAFTSLMNDLYLEAQSQVMSSLYLTERAFHFWGLTKESILAKLLQGKTIIDINKALLEVAKSSILSAYEKVVENYGGNAQKFPKNENDKGKLWELKQSDIETLKVADYEGNYSVLVNVPIDDMLFSPFSSIRLTNIRVWIEGATVDDNIMVLNITHTGNETITNQDKYQFIFNHNPKTLNFIYNLKNLSILEDGDLGYGKHNKYALVGPFTWWNIKIKSSDNKNLDLAKLSKVTLEFRFENYSYRFL
jgi:archaellum component FlaC